MPGLCLVRPKLIQGRSRPVGDRNDSVSGHDLIFRVHLETTTLREAIVGPQFPCRETFSQVARSTQRQLRRAKLPQIVTHQSKIASLSEADAREAGQWMSWNLRVRATALHRCRTRFLLWFYTINRRTDSTGPQHGTLATRNLLTIADRHCGISRRLDGAKT